MIRRIFKVRIDSNQRDAFERDFASVSVEAAVNREGFLGLEIGKPLRWNPDDYVMIGDWRDEASLVAFASTRWNRAVIPPPMEKYVVSCSVEHCLFPDR